MVDVNYVLVLNEPLVYATMSYLSGDWPPSLKRPIKTIIVLINLTRAHKLAYRNQKIILLAEQLSKRVITFGIFGF